MLSQHTEFSVGNAGKNIKNSCMEKVIVTNSMSLDPSFKKEVGGKVHQVNIDILLAEVIRRMELKESMKELYEIPNY